MGFGTTSATRHLFLLRVETEFRYLFRSADRLFILTVKKNLRLFPTRVRQDAVQREKEMRNRPEEGSSAHRGRGSRGHGSCAFCSPLPSIVGRRGASSRRGPASHRQTEGHLGHSARGPALPDVRSNPSWEKPTEVTGPGSSCGFGAVSTRPRLAQVSRPRSGGGGAGSELRADGPGGRLSIGHGLRLLPGGGDGEEGGLCVQCVGDPSPERRLHPIPRHVGDRTFPVGTAGRTHSASEAGTHGHPVPSAR